MAKLTKRFVEAVQPQSKGHVVWDDEFPGFGLRVYLTSAEIRACFTTSTPAALVEKAVARQGRLKATMINGEVEWDVEQPHEFLAGKSGNVQDGVMRFRGDVCCRGQASGTARVLTGSDDIDRLQQDDILIAPMLVPEIIRGVHKVRAIVTSAGAF